MTASKIKTITLAISALFIAGSIIAFPETSVKASLAGLKMWWNIVFPSLLPFFIVAELLIAFGIVTFIGVLLEPIMRPIFKVPGIGGFVFIMGLASGFPAGAKITARLYEENQLTKTEAERLASFTNFSNPLFMFGVLAIGFFHKEALGIIFALSHYIGNILVGLIMRFYKSNEHSTRPKEVRGSGPANMVIFKAFKKMHEERMSRKQPIGKMLGDAVQSSVQTLLMVGGFIILFSVFNRLLDALNGTEIIAFGIKQLLLLLHFTPALGSAFVPGLFEITVGAQRVSEVHAPLIEAVIVVAFILGFGGFSIQAQVASILAEAKLSAKPFFIGRLFHGLFSAIAAGLLFKLFSISDVRESGTVMAVAEPFQRSYIYLEAHSIYAFQWGSLITLITLITFIMSKMISKTRELPR